METAPGWVGGAVIGAIMILGDRLIQWWQRIKAQRVEDAIKLGDQKAKNDKTTLDIERESFSFIVCEYQKLIAAGQTESNQLKDELRKIAQEHSECNVKVAALTARLEAAEGKIKELEAKLEKP